ncbi:CAP domain-containing protein [Sphingomonas sp. KRR8]|uniref:CAP domain-containing protein n=1 Tax=Sphingomonas sp. KRR8 TaxID=2942996 RepID=UPI0020226474|nr:CAP domain-containing protein [Sphingomonas sp. KRR8]URD61525.1 CAP domain-containing protein [Sphingomonas sp. KRR8]
MQWRAGLAAAAGLGLALASAPAAGQSRIIYPLTMRLLVPQNVERSRWGVGPLQWDQSLAFAADQYAAELARTNRWGHSAKTSRPGQGENLWMGSRGAFSPEQMVGSWLSEAGYYRPSVFPYVSRTGNWADVGHYTQIIWRQTTKVGCAIRSNGRWDYLVCRYSPHGNVDGRTAV